MRECLRLSVTAGNTGPEATCCSVAAVSLFILPESPRWLVVNGHLDMALAVIHRVFTSSVLPTGALPPLLGMPASKDTVFVNKCKGGDKVWLSERDQAVLVKHTLCWKRL